MGNRNFLHDPPERVGLCPGLSARSGAWPPTCVAGEGFKEMLGCDLNLSYTWIFSPDLSVLCPASCNARELLPGGELPAGIWEPGSIMGMGISWVYWYNTNTHCLFGLGKQPQLIQQPCSAYSANGCSHWSLRARASNSTCSI